MPGHSVPILTNAHHSEMQTKQSLPVVDQQQLSGLHNVAALLRGPVTHMGFGRRQCVYPFNKLHDHGHHLSFLLIISKHKL